MKTAEELIKEMEMSFGNWPDICAHQLARHLRTVSAQSAGISLHIAEQQAQKDIDSYTKLWQGR